MTNVAILGSRGMLGSTLTKVLESNNFTVYEFNRSGISVTGNNKVREFDILSNKNLHEIFEGLKIDYIVNCIGLIKHLINEEKPDSVDLAYRINADFPNILNNYSIKYDIPVIEIGTDCVFSGKFGGYSELDLFDPLDCYGLTKSIGESVNRSAMIIRCSIVGKELNSNNSLMSWVLSQPKNASINGFSNHIWNGVSTLHFSQVVFGIINTNSHESGVTHLIPKDVINKYDLISYIAMEFGRDDLIIYKTEAAVPVDRSLSTVKKEENLKLWRQGGYNSVPTIEKMISDYKKWVKPI